MAKKGIHIKPSKKGTFTAAAKKHGKSVQAFASQVLANKDNYSSAMVKKANFAKNASKWHKGQKGINVGLSPVSESSVVGPVTPYEELTPMDRIQEGILHGIIEGPKDRDATGYYNSVNNPKKNHRKLKNISETIATLLTTADAAIPGDKLRYPVVRPELSYNPYQYGTGSQAIAKNGITISETGYKRNSKDKNKSKLRIPSNMITMEDVDFPVLGTSDNGITKIMYPGENHVFPGANFVDEERVVAQKGAAIRQPIYTSSPNDPRLRAYNDSLTVYNDVNKFNSIIKKYDNDISLLPDEKHYLNKEHKKAVKIVNENKWKVNNVTNPDNFLSPFGSFQKPVQPVIYQPEPKIDAPDKRQTSYSRNLGILPINVNKPNVSQSLYDPTKPTNWSFTYPTGEYNQQNTIYFPDETMWKNFINKQRNVTSQHGNNSGSATGYMEYGGVIPNISKNRKKFKHGGEIEPLTDDVVQFNGPSHADGGIDIMYGNKGVEVEGDETGYFSQDGSLNIMGNMINPLTNRKFKEDSKRLAKKEQKVNELLDYSFDLVDEGNPTDKWGLLKFNSGLVQMQGAMRKKMELMKSKEHLADMQKAMLELSGEEAIAQKGKVVFPTKKQILGKAQWGRRIPRIGKESIVPDTETSVANILRRSDPASMLDPDKYLAMIYSREGGKTGVDPKIKGHASGKYALMPATQKEVYNKYYKSSMKWKDFKESYDTDPKFEYEVARHLAEDKINSSKTVEEAIGSWYYPKWAKKGHWDEVPEKSYGNILTVGQYVDKALGNYNNGKTTVDDDAIYRTEDEQELLDYKPNKFNPKKPSKFGDNSVSLKRVGTVDYNTNITEPSRLHKSMNIKDLSLTQIAPELLTLADNQVEPVFMQQYHPDLYQPYSVSFQDQLDENTATFLPFARYSRKNPEALATLAAQKYRADQNVLANEFRTNQGIEQDIVNKNIALLNDAELKNLSLADTQYTRQEQAKSNTKQQNLLALESISNKIAQNELEKRTLQVYENLYPYYSYDENYGLNYSGPKAGESLFQIPSTATKSAQVTVREDSKGNQTISKKYPSSTQQDLQNLTADQKRLDLSKNLLNWLNRERLNR